MAGVLAYRSPRAREETTAWLGMVFFLASWAILFAALFFAYGMLRARASAWPPAGEPILTLGLPSIATVLIAASSAALQYGLGAARRGSARAIVPSVAGAGLLGLGFLAVQTLSWWQMYAAGLRPDSGPYGSVFYAITCFHALHVLAGIFGLGAVLLRVRSGAVGPARHLPLRLWAMYWHFVGVLWAVTFVTVYLV